jgi:regulator of RNase E activity RraA
MTPVEPLTAAELDVLRGIPSPTIANALERFKVRGNCEGWTTGPVRCLFPELGAVVGYAVTLTVRSAPPIEKPKYPSRKPYWDHIAAYPAPRVVVAQELDQPSVGAFWGEVNANIHRALGCVGVITDGSVRDLDEVRRLGFHFWAAGVQVSHGYARLDDFNQPVTVFGMTVRPGDLIHADQHGAVIIPAEVARQVAAAAKVVEDRERPMIQLCSSPNFSTAKLAELLEHAII